MFCMFLADLSISFIFLNSLTGCKTLTNQTILIIHSGGCPIIRLGDKEVEYNYDFRFYITTKLSNPHYTPEISTKACTVNFAVKEQGKSDLFPTFHIKFLMIWEG